jgi:hypothetical protein
MADDPIAAHYGLGFERDRLFRDGEPRLELTRTLELLDRFLPSAPARLIDVGGGPGAYAVARHQAIDRSPLTAMNSNRDDLRRESSSPRGCASLRL